MARIEEFLAERRKTGLLRALRPAGLRKRGIIYFGKDRLVDLGSNDYLGLSGHPKLKEASRKAAERFGTSASASRLLSGDLELTHKLEDELAVFKKKENALVFNSGYQANVGIISSLCAKGDVIFIDRLSHASIIDGALLSGAKFFRFNHNDAVHLEALLKKERRDHKEALIITETIFSMDGDKAPLKDIVGLKERYDCKLMVDEAHATGIFGAKGSGVVEEENLSEDVDLIMGTFSKALGGFGAYLASSRKIIDYLINSCRSFIYSTALPPPVIAADLAGLDLIRKEPFRRTELLKNAKYFRGELKRRKFDVRGSSQIAPLIIGNSAKAVRFSQDLKNKGYWAPAIRPPAVPAEEARIRFSLSYDHSEDILKGLIDEICEISGI